jgi:hypothetical protein
MAVGLGLVTYRHDSQALLASESLGQMLRQLAVHGRDGLPVLSADGRQVLGWVTNASVMRSLAHQIAGSQPDQDRSGAEAPVATAPEAEEAPRHPPVPLEGYRVVEVTLPEDSPAAGLHLRDVPWPLAAIPVSVLHARRLRAPEPDVTLFPGDRVSLLVPVREDQPA